MVFECAGFLHENVAALERAFAADAGGNGALVRNILAGEREQRRAVLAAERERECGGAFLGVAGTDDVEIGNEAQGADGLHRLVRRAVLADADAVVREDVGDGQFAERGEADARAAVVGEHEERGAAGAEEAVVGDAVADRAHGVLADAEPDVAAQRILLREIAAVLDVVLRGAEEVGAAGDDMRAPPSRGG